MTNRIGPAGRTSATIAVLLVLLTSLVCPQASQAADPVSSDAAALFDTRRLLDVQIQLAPEDWNALRMEHHDLLAALGPTRIEKPEPNPYRTYKADVTIDGTRFRSVGVRKRGFLGSASSRRPSLGIRLDAFEPQQAFRDLRRLALNNNLQDASQLHQVLAYRVFAKAGVAAPRCNLARVTVNGKSLGIYSHVEAIEESFLMDHFGGADGHLYEGQLSDFRPGWVKTFQTKNHKDSPDRSDLEAVVRALQSEDGLLLARLEPRVELDAYLGYWAVETLIGHWDSYSNNGNNFFIYRAPATGKFVFIPWGADSVFGDKDPFTPFKMPESVKARSLLARRLYLLPATRERYRARLRHVLETAWNERELIEEVDRLQALVKDQVHVSPFHFRMGVNKVRTFIRNRRTELEKELNGPPPEWDIPLKKGPCFEKAGALTALFSTPWRTSQGLSALTNGAATLNIDLDGQTPSFAWTSAVAGPGDDPRIDGCPVISLVGLRRGSLRLSVLALVIQPEFYKPAQSLKIDGFAVGGALLEGVMLSSDFRIAGFPVGTLQLQAAGTRPGEEVSGRVQVDLYQLPE